LESSFGPAKMKALFDQRIKIKKNIMSKQNSTILILGKLIKIIRLAK
jgi:hypothetical protein